MQSKRHLPKGVSVYHGSYRLDLGRINGKRKYATLCRITAGDHALYESLAAHSRAEEPTLSVLIDAFLARGMNNLAPATQKGYIGYAEPLRAEFGHMKPDDINSGQIAKYLDMREQSGAGISGNREKAVLSSVFNYGMRKGVCKNNPCVGVRRNKEKIKIRI